MPAEYDSSWHHTVPGGTRRRASLVSVRDHPALGGITEGRLHSRESGPATRWLYRDAVVRQPNRTGEKRTDGAWASNGENTRMGRPGQTGKYSAHGGDCLPPTGGSVTPGARAGAASTTGSSHSPQGRSSDGTASREVWSTTSTSGPEASERGSRGQRLRTTSRRSGPTPPADPGRSKHPCTDLRAASW
jgi:hypothetical protein